MIKKAFFLMLMLCVTSGLFALDSIFTGVGVEINGHTRNGMAVGGGLLFGLDLDQQHSMGLRTSFFHNLATVSCLETNILIRYYIPQASGLFGFDGGLFAQAELGLIVFFEYGKVFPAFSGGAAAGWRINMGTFWFIEPTIRVGYPHMWGLNLMTGPRFYIRDKSK